MSGLWVFGYGSLVSPESFGRTLGRELRPGIDLFEAELAGFGRRWNYGIAHSVGVWTDDDGVEHERTIVALGLVEAPHESVNGVVGYVELDELTDLDRRERHYDRVDVADRTSVRTDGSGRAASGPGRSRLAGSIMVYVPARAAVERYERARDAGSAAVERRYWDLVDAAFRALGDDQHARYHATTPAPDVPIVDLVRR